MEKITGFNFDTSDIPAGINPRAYTVYGTVGAVFSIEVMDSSSKFYNFSTNAFTTAYTSENRLSNIRIEGSYTGSIVFPGVSSDDTYKIYLWAEPHFETEIAPNVSSNSILYITTVRQLANRYIRFGLGSDQASGKFSNLYNGSDAATYATATGSNTSNATPIISVDLTTTDPSTPALGYKCIAPFIVDTETGTVLKTPRIDTTLQPIDSNFYTVVTTQTDGFGTDSTSMTVDSVDGLVIGMSLVDIADSGDLEQSGTLGVLTYPTITDISGKVLTLSAAPDWSDNKAVVFRAYGSELIRESTNADVNFIGFKYTPYQGANTSTSTSAERSVNEYTIAINGDMSGTSLTIDGTIKGLSAGSYIKGADVSEASSANLITVVHSSGTPITMTGAQVLADNTRLKVFGSTATIQTTGEIEVRKFPTSDTVIYLDIDKAFVLATLTA